MANRRTQFWISLLSVANATLLVLIVLELRRSPPPLRATTSSTAGGGLQPKRPMVEIRRSAALWQAAPAGTDKWTEERQRQYAARTRAAIEADFGPLVSALQLPLETRVALRDLLARAQTERQMAASYLAEKHLWADDPAARSEFVAAVGAGTQAQIAALLGNDGVAALDAYVARLSLRRQLIQIGGRLAGDDGAMAAIIDDYATVARRDPLSGRFLAESVLPEAVIERANGYLQPDEALQLQRFQTMRKHVRRMTDLLRTLEPE